MSNLLQVGLKAIGMLVFKPIPYFAPEGLPIGNRELSVPVRWAHQGQRLCSKLNPKNYAPAGQRKSRLKRRMKLSQAAREGYQIKL